VVAPSAHDGNDLSTRAPQEVFIMLLIVFALFVTAAAVHNTWGMCGDLTVCIKDGEVTVFEGINYWDFFNRKNCLSINTGEWTTIYIPWEEIERVEFMITEWDDEDFKKSQSKIPGE